MVFNPSAMDRLSHVLMGCWQAGAWFVISVSAYYLLKNRHRDFADASLKIALVIAALASLGQLITGHSSAVTVSRHQPAKLAAMEGHYDAMAPASLYFVGWVNERKEKLDFAVGLPGLLSFLVRGDPNQSLAGLRAFRKEDRPPVQIVFQAYHGMVLIGLGLIILALLGIFLWWRGRLFKTRWLLKLYVVSVLGPQMANQLGWMTAEMGRQPWAVYGLLRTEDGVSPNLSSSDVLISLILFMIIYTLLFVLFIYLLDQKIRKGPVEEETLIEGHRA